MFDLIKRKYIDLISDTRFSEILTGSAWALMARVVSTVLSLTVSVIVARFYGAETIGIIAVVNAFLLLTTIFTVFGTGTSILRLIPEHIAKYSPKSAYKVYTKTQNMVGGFSLITGSICLLGANIIAEQIFSKPHLSFYFALASLFIIFKSTAILNAQAVRGLRLVKAFAFMLFLPQLANLFLLVILSVFLSTQNVPVYALLGGFAITSITGWLIIRYTFKQKIRPDAPVCVMPAKSILAISLPMLLTSTMVFVIGQTGVIMLGMFRSEAEVGYYAIAVKLATLTVFILQAIDTIAAPKYSELFHSNKIDELFHVAQKTAKLIFWLSVPLLLGFILLGKPFLQLAYGNEFSVAYPALLFLIPGQLIGAMAGTTGSFMNMTNNQRVFSNIMICAALINVGLNFLLIPDNGIIGSAIAATSSLAFWNITSLVYIKMKFGKTIGYFPRFFL